MMGVLGGCACDGVDICMNVCSYVVLHVYNTHSHIHTRLTSTHIHAPNLYHLSLRRVRVFRRD
jgi:hypothetical protein